MTFNPNEHLMQFERRAKKNGVWITTTTDYLPVQWRLVWFREACPQGTIHTEEIVVDMSQEVEEEASVYNQQTHTSEKVTKRGRGYARFKATVTDGMGGSATGTKSETIIGFPDYIEKAETGAIGRALAGLGYGTQFAPDLDEGQRIVDSPVTAEGRNSDIAQNGSSTPTNGNAAPAVARLGNRSEAQRDRLSSSLDQPQAQSKPVLDMIARAKQRAQSLQLLWDDVKRDTFAGRCPADDTLTVQMVAQINGVLAVVEKGPKSA